MGLAVTTAGFALSSCEKEASSTTADQTRLDGQYIAPGEWRSSITQTDIAAFSALYGPTGSHNTSATLQSRTEGDLAAGAAVQLIEAGVNYDNAGVDATGDNVEVEPFQFKVSSDSIWSETTIADVYAAVASEIADIISANASSGREVGAINLIGPIVSGLDTYLEGEIYTFSAISSVIEPTLTTLSWNDVPRTGCSFSNVTFPIAHQNFAAASKSDLASRKCDPMDHVYTFDHVKTVTSYDEIGSLAGTVYYDITDFTTGVAPGNDANRGQYRTHFDLYKQQLCLNRSKVDHYGSDAYLMGSQQGHEIYDIPGNVSVEEARYIPAAVSVGWTPIELSNTTEFRPNFWLTKLLIGRVGIHFDVNSNCQ